MNVKRAIDITEKAFFVLIAVFTVAAMLQEAWLVVENRNVELKDLLLMFIYAEVLGMLGAFYSSHRIPITIPLFIAVTALSRLIILQGKEGEPSILLFESGAILMIAIACWIVYARPKSPGLDLHLSASAGNGRQPTLCRRPSTWYLTWFQSVMHTAIA